MITPYTLTLPDSLSQEWGWFEQRGYLPSMPGTLQDDGSLALTEPEAWNFQQECEELGEAFLSCVADPAPILSLLESIV